MSKTADKLRTIRIYNEHGIVEDGHPYLAIHSRQSRSVLPACVFLHIKGRTLKGGAWYENGGKMFSYGGINDKPEAIEKAFAFVEKMFPGLKMVKSPFGGGLAWVPEIDLKDKLEKAEEHLKGIGG